MEDPSYILPRELCLHILSFLSPSELRNCFLVSKAWFELANTDYLWKKHCIERELHIYKVALPSNRPESLCHWASIYRTFSRKLNKWSGDRGDYFGVTVSSNNYVLAAGDLSLVIFNFSSKEDSVESMSFYEFLEGDVQLQTTHEVRLPGVGLVQLFTNDVYTVVCRDNFIYCMKKNQLNYGDYLGLSVYGGNLEQSTEKVLEFIMARRCHSRDLSMKLLCGKYLWFEDSKQIIYVYNLDERKFITIKYFTTVKLTNQFVALWTNCAVNIYTPSGQLIASLLTDYLYDVCVNRNILAGLFPETCHLYRLLQTFDLKTGQKLTEYSLTRFSDICLHRSRDLVYALERSCRDLYRVSCLCARRGTALWAYSRANLYYNMWPASVSMVSHKHLFVWPSYNRTDKYLVFNIETGQFLYVSKTLTQGNTQFISDNLCVSVSGVDVMTKNFL